jgi:hypothetical protein
MAICQTEAISIIPVFYDLIVADIKERMKTIDARTTEFFMYADMYIFKFETDPIDGKEDDASLILNQWEIISQRYGLIEHLIHS